MLDHRSFKVATLRAVAFISDSTLEAKTILRKLSDTWMERFDGEYLMIPPFEDAPLELPILLLRSRQKDDQCTFSSSSVDLRHSPRDPDSIEPEGLLKQFYVDASDLLMELPDVLDYKLTRVGAVVTRYARLEQPGLTLAQHFCKAEMLDSPLNRPESFELHAHKLYSARGRDINSWVRVKTGRVNAQEQAVLVEQDINTPPVSPQNFTATDAQAFFELVPSEMEEILGKYFKTEH